MTEIEAKVGRIEPTDVLAGSIEEIEDGIVRCLHRRDEIDAETTKLKAERDQVEATIAEAQKKKKALAKALELAQDAADLAPNLPGELKPAAGDGEAPPTSPKPAAQLPPKAATPPPSSNGHRSTKPASAVKQRIRDAMAGRDWLSQREIIDSVESLPRHTARTYIQDMVKAGIIEAQGSTRGRRYRLVEGTTRTPAQAPAARKARPASEDRPKAKGMQEPTQEGRVLSALQGGQMDLAQLSTHIGIPIPKCREIIGKLLREGDVRLKKGNPPAYYAMP